MNDQHHNTDHRAADRRRIADSSATPSAPRTLSRRGALAAGGAASLLPFAAMSAASAAPAGKGGNGKGKGGGGKGGGKSTVDIDALLAEMTIEQKIGQMFVAVGYGATADESHRSNTTTTGVDTIEKIVRTHHVGGLIYFAWSGNMVDIPQVTTLSNDAQKAALDSGGIPLLISTDEERGVVFRLPAPATPLPGAMGLGATGSHSHARKAGDIIGTELRACGINQGFAPVVDVNIEAQNPVIGVRSFGADPETVSRLATAQIKGMQKADCSSTVKHFPGHGDTAVDSHYGLPVIDHTREELDELDLPPFIAAIEEDVDAIMTAHIVVPVLDDSGLPATLSKPILTGLLREELGYEGVIVTDSLAMEGVRIIFSDDRVPVEAILAGADQMLMPPNLTVAISGVRDAVANGEITEERLDESVRRILTQKVKRGIFDAPYADVDEAVGAVGTRKSVKTAQKIADDSVTLIADDGTLPLRRRTKLLVTGVGSQVVLDNTVAELKEQGIDATGVLLGTINAAAQAKAVAAAADAEAVLVFTSSAGFVTPKVQVDLVKALVATGKPVINASLRNPYDVVHVGPVNSSIAAYGNSACNVRAVARLVAGDIKPKGTLPVAIPEADGTGEAYPLGHKARFGG